MTQRRNPRAPHVSARRLVRWLSRRSGVRSGTAERTPTFFRIRSAAAKALLRGFGYRGIHKHERPFGIAELSSTIAPRHHLRLAHHFHVIFQPRELGFYIFDLELHDSGAVGCGLGASLLK